MTPQAQYFFQRLILKLTAIFSESRQAVLLSFVYQCYQILINGHEEIWLRRRLLTLPLHLRIMFPFPYVIRSRIWMIVYALKCMRGGYIHPGIARYLERSRIQPTQHRHQSMATSGWPEFIINDLKALSTIEPSLFPDASFLNRYHSYATPVEEIPGQTLRHLMTACPGTYDVVLIVPWLRHGGADRGITQFCAYYQQRQLRTLLITTYPAESTWLHRIEEKNIHFLQFGQITNNLLLADQELILARFLVQKKPKLIHLVQSELGYRVFSQFHRQLHDIGCKLVVSTFAHEFNEHGLRIGYAEQFLPQLREAIDLILSDNEVFLKEINQQYCIDPTRTHFIPFHIDTIPLKERSQTTGDRTSFLWGSRLCYQKRPDLLLDIAKQCTEYDFYVYGEPDHWAKKIHHNMEKISNIYLGGRFESFHTIAQEHPYAGFIYTSIFDGTPNVLLEAAMETMPVIAPINIGGIGALVNHNTGYPVQNALCTEEYVRHLRHIADNPQEAQIRAQALHLLVASRHSSKQFQSQMDAALKSITLN